jgi:oxygen-independent coproporphyrinogen-3 oxidase
VAIEVDPRVTTGQHLETLARLGFNRLSMGVQDFTPEVQQAIGRGQTFEETRAIMATARELGFGEGINIDLVYGLPEQTEATYERNLDRLLELRPDRWRSTVRLRAVDPAQPKRIDPRAAARDARWPSYRAAAPPEPIGMITSRCPRRAVARRARGGSTATSWATRSSRPRR